MVWSAIAVPDIAINANDMSSLNMASMILCVEVKSPIYRNQIYRIGSFPDEVGKNVNVRCGARSGQWLGG